MATKENASVVVTWNYGANTVIDDFNPMSDTIFIDWFGPDEITVTESNGNLIFSIPSNEQTITLSNIDPEDLSPSNFTIKNSGTEEKVFAMISDEGGPIQPPEPPVVNPPDIVDEQEYRVVGWFQQAGSLWGPKYQVEDVPAEHLTHLVYAFASIDDDGEMTIKSVSNGGEQPALDNFEKLARLKADHPDLKLIMAVGGWSDSKNFSSTFDTKEGREHFADSVVDFLQEHDMFDGIDLDWEFPGIQGQGNSWSVNDGENYALAVAEIRKELDLLTAETGRDYDISVAISTNKDKVAKTNMEGLEPNVDFFNMMAYDINGTWQDTTDHQAPIFDTDGTANTRDIATAVENYLERGIPADKIVIGAPMYTRAWEGVEADSPNPNDVLRVDSDGPAPGTRGEGVYYYSDLLEKVQDPDSGWKLYFDDEAQVAYVWNQEEKIFSSMETPETIALKSAWAKEMGLSGVQFWSLQHDASGHQESLLKAASDFWLEGKSIQEIANASEVEFDAVFGGDGKVAPFWETDTPEPGTGSGTETGSGVDKVAVTWNWGQQDVYENFDPKSDVLEFDQNIASQHLKIEEIDNDLLITVLNNNDHTILLEGIQAEDLTVENLINADNGMIEQLHSLGMEDTII